MSKKCTPLWCEAHFEVKSVEKTDGVRALLEVEMPKKCKPLWREVKSVKKTDGFRALLEVDMPKKCKPLWREAHFEVNMLKTPHVRTTFGGSDVVSRGRGKGLCTVSKVSKTWGFCSISKNDGRLGTFEEDLHIFRGRRSTRGMFIRAVRRSGRWFPERGCMIFRFAEAILRDRCSTSYDLASLFHGRRNTLDRWSWKIARCIGTRLSALQLSIFEGSLAELLRFWCRQLGKMRRSRRIVSFLMLSSSKIEEVSQKCCVLKLTVRETDRQTNR